jgi:precorrin-3B synthase
MPSGDGLLVRVKPFAAQLPAAGARAVADAALRFGNGIIELTSRANLQVRGLSSVTVAAFARAMEDVGLSSGDIGAERRRNVIVSPLADMDLSVAPGTAALGRAVEAMLVASADLAGLNGKFRIVVDGAGILPLGDVACDLRVVVQADRVLLAAAGMESAAVCSQADALPALRRLLRAASQAGPACRMRDLHGERLFQAVCLEPSMLLPAGVAVSPIGYLLYGDGEHGAFGFGLRFGQLDAAILLRLADLAERFGDGTLRTTPWRTLLVPGVTRAGADMMRTLAEGIVTDPTDPALAIAACPGMSACVSASVATRGDAMWLAMSGHANGTTIHVSGCAKGCAHPAPAAVTLVGEGGRYGLVRNGRADAPPVLRGLTIQQAAAVLAAEDRP